MREGDGVVLDEGRLLEARHEAVEVGFQVGEGGHGGRFFLTILEARHVAQPRDAFVDGSAVSRSFVRQGRSVYALQSSVSQRAGISPCLIVAHIADERF